MSLFDNFGSAYKNELSSVVEGARSAAQSNIDALKNIGMPNNQITSLLVKTTSLSSKISNGIDIKDGDASTINGRDSLYKTNSAFSNYDAKPTISSTQKNLPTSININRNGQSFTIKTPPIANTLINTKQTEKQIPLQTTGQPNKKKSNEVTSPIYDYSDTKVVDTSMADIGGFKIPTWGYDDFINERNIWHKSLYSFGGEPTWFYFKIFFNFDTQYGLLGGLLNNTNPLAATNTAYKYLDSCYLRGKFERTQERQVALMRFAKMLSYINTVTPWFFNGINGLDQAGVPLVDDFTKERYISIECNQESVDMRLSNLLDLYKFVCYDEMNQKEIIPDNLRKFDMSVMVFGVPLKYIHSGFKATGKNFEYKRIFDGSNQQNMMSFKMFTFINCEINRESIGNMVPSSMKNEAPFELGKKEIKINYDRVYTHTMNEFNHFFFGSDGVYYDGYAENNKIWNSKKVQQQNRMTSIASSYGDNKKYEVNADQFKSLVSASEAICNYNLRKAGFNALGNIFPDDQQNFKAEKTSSGAIIFTPTDYMNLKLKLIKGVDNINELYNIVSGTSNPIVTEMINSYIKFKANKYLQGFEQSDMATVQGMGYWRRKLAQLKDHIVAPEINITSAGNQVYDYRNFTYEGYGNKILTTDKNGYPDNSAGSQHFKEKMWKLKNGTI